MTETAVRLAGRPQIGETAYRYSTDDNEVMLCWLVMQTLQRTPDNSPLQMNDLVRVSLRSLAPLFWDTYKKNRQTGAVLLVYEFTHDNVARDMIP